MAGTAGQKQQKKTSTAVAKPIVAALTKSGTGRPAMRLQPVTKAAAKGVAKGAPKAGAAVAKKSAAAKPIAPPKKSAVAEPKTESSLFEFPGAAPPTVDLDQSVFSAAAGAPTAEAVQPGGNFSLTQEMEQTMGSDSDNEPMQNLAKAMAASMAKASEAEAPTLAMEAEPPTLATEAKPPTLATEAKPPAETKPAEALPEEKEEATADPDVKVVRKARPKKEAKPHLGEDWNADQQSAFSSIVAISSGDEEEEVEAKPGDSTVLGKCKECKLAVTKEQVDAGTVTRSTSYKKDKCYESYIHKSCRSMQTVVNGLLKGFENAHETWRLSPMEEKLAWWQKNSGLSPYDLCTELQGYLEDKRTEVLSRDLKKKTTPMSETQLETAVKEGRLSEKEVQYIHVYIQHLSVCMQIDM
jgi:hypothetical protein